MFKFKPEDFEKLDGYYQQTGTTLPSVAIAYTVNKMLQAHLATLPKVYGHPRNGEIVYAEKGFAKDATTTALLWGITEIEKKECEHEVNPATLSSNWNFNQVCLHCGVKLKAKWEKA